MNIRLRQYGYCLLMLALILPFQNCSQPAEFKTHGSSSQTDGLNLSGGEGYGGKVYALISESDVCPKGTAASEIHVNAAGEAHLVSQDCEVLSVPKPIVVTYDDEDPSLLIYNGRFYQDTLSGAPAPGISSPTLLTSIEIENMSRVPSDSSVEGEFLRITDNDFASHTLNFPNSAQYQLVIRARGNVINGEGSILEVRVDGVLVGSIVATEVAGDYWFTVDVQSGNHEVALSFTNDYYNSATSQDRNLYLDVLKIVER